MYKIYYYSYILQVSTEDLKYLRSQKVKIVFVLDQLIVEDLAKQFLSAFAIS